MGSSDSLIGVWKCPAVKSSVEKKCAPTANQDNLGYAELHLIAYNRHISRTFSFLFRTKIIGDSHRKMILKSLLAFLTDQ